MTRGRGIGAAEDRPAPGVAPGAYFDYAASSPPHAEALDAYVEVARSFFANPSSSHLRGMQARKRLEAARERCKALLGVAPGARVVITSGGTEANNLVLHSFLGEPAEGRVLLANDVHPSSWKAGHRAGDRVDVLKVDGRGLVGLETLAARLTPRHGLVSIAHGNNETGVVQDLEGIASLCAARGAWLHVDGAQAVGHLPLALGSLDRIFYTFSSHKFGAPRGSGGVITGSPERLRPLLLGGSQEGGLRAGTEDAAAFCAAVTALDVSLREFPAKRNLLKGFAEQVIRRVVARFPEALVNSAEEGLPGLVSLSLPGLNGTLAVTEMAMKGFDLSAGSACHAGSSEPSRVIRALGRTRLEALGTLRISMGYATTQQDVDAMVDALLSVIERGLEVG
ncbi:MAG: cysteine desulfurase [Deltaproteobacteria bacterium]|nr:cysteine desulfurase [Deltaproteobacteria bacterium]